MQTNVHEVAEGVYRLSTLIPEAAPGGLTFNQYLLTGEEPMLFHTGARQLFPLVADAVAKVLDVERLRWISFGHVESDECGSMNLWLDAAPTSEVLFNPLGCDVSLNDLCDRMPVVAVPDERRDLGGHVVRTIMTPHVPHGWEAQVLFDETSRTLFCGDVFGQVGDAPGHGARCRHRATRTRRGGHVRGHGVDGADRADAPAARGTRAANACVDARSGVRRRLHASAARPGRRV